MVVKVLVLVPGRHVSYLILPFRPAFFDVVERHGRCNGAAESGGDEDGREEVHRVGGLPSDDNDVSS